MKVARTSTSLVDADDRQIAAERNGVGGFEPGKDRMALPCRGRGGGVPGAVDAGTQLGGEAQIGVPGAGLDVGVGRVLAAAAAALARCTPKRLAESEIAAAFAIEIAGAGLRQWR